MRLDKSSARRRLEKKGSYEKEIDLQTFGSVGGKKPQHSGNRLVCPIRNQRGGVDLAICAANQLVAVASNWNRDRTTRRPANYLVKAGLFDNE